MKIVKITHRIWAKPSAKCLAYSYAVHAVNITSDYCKREVLWRVRINFIQHKEGSQGRLPGRRGLS